MLSTTDRRCIEIENYDVMDRDLEFAQSQLDFVEIHMDDDSSIAQLIVFEMYLANALCIVNRHGETEFEIIDGDVICANRDTQKQWLLEALDDVRAAKRDRIAETQRQLERWFVIAA